MAKQNKQYTMSEILVANLATMELLKNKKFSSFFLKYYDEEEYRLKEPVKQIIDGVIPGTIGLPYQNRVNSIKATAALLFLLQQKPVDRLDFFTTFAQIHGNLVTKLLCMFKSVEMGIDDGAPAFVYKNKLECVFSEHLKSLTESEAALHVIVCDAYIYPLHNDVIDIVEIDENQADTLKELIPSFEQVKAHTIKTLEAAFIQPISPEVKENTQNLQKSYPFGFQKKSLDGLYKSWRDYVQDTEIISEESAILNPFRAAYKVSYSEGIPPFIFDKALLSKNNTEKLSDCLVFGIEPVKKYKEIDTEKVINDINEDKDKISPLCPVEVTARVDTIELGYISSYCYIAMFQSLSKEYVKEIKDSLKRAFFPTSTKVKACVDKKGENKAKREKDEAIKELEKVREQLRVATQEAESAKNRASYYKAQNERIVQDLIDAQQETPTDNSAVEEDEIFTEEIGKEQPQEKTIETSEKKTEESLTVLTKSNRIVIVGGFKRLMGKLQDKYPSIELIDDQNYVSCEAAIRNSDLVLFKPDHMRHSMYKKGKQLAVAAKVPVGYIGRVASVPRLEEEILGEIENLLQEKKEGA